ncbi:phosphoglucosamine mutase [Desulfovibrio sp. OttesenSCG-928-G15]|nr:phosphoglucosamine mutase [Desulfovibrio sp. OttesenSCG-928-G15]
MKRLFGTDGMRGTVNQYPMLPDLALRVGLAAGSYFRTGEKRHRVVIGKDTRLSGYIYENALTAGLCASGMDVFLVGPLPTPAIAFLTRNMRADFGIVISASHNPFQDNGIKFFDSQGFKLPDKVESIITDMVLDNEWDWDYPAPDKVGRAFKIQDAPGRYIVSLKNSFPTSMSLEGIRVVLDCANGANYRVAPMALKELGAEVVSIGISPDGLNINDKVGSLHPEVTAAKVRETRADIGIALDGDADRVIVVDETGNILDGDQILAVCALDFMEKGQLPGNKLVGTVMSNLSLEIFMRKHGGELLRADVGDRYVTEMMREHGATLGGEQSGHIVFMDHGTTGDGLLAGLQILRIMRERKQPLSQLANLLKRLPQKLLNVRVREKLPFEDIPAIQESVAKAEKALSDQGRVLLRYSGTEKLARVMVEGYDEDQVERIAKEIADVLRSTLG